VANISAKNTNCYTFVDNWQIVLLPQGTVIDGADIFIIGGTICGGGKTANVYHLDAGNPNTNSVLANSLPGKGFVEIDKTYSILVHLSGGRSQLMCSVTDVLADTHGRGIMCVVHSKFEFMSLAKGWEKNSSDKNVTFFQRTVTK
jgi:hypothetical protein